MCHSDFVNLLTKLSLLIIGLLRQYIAGLPVPKKRFILLVLFKRFFFLLTQAEINGFQPVKSRYFRIGQQKKRSARKEPVKRTSILGHVN